MKFFSKIAAILAALMLACAFVACSNDGGSSDDESIIATYSGTHTETNGGQTQTMTMIFKFYSGNKVQISIDGILLEGTYTGNPTSGSGTISYYDGGAQQSFNDPYSVSGTTMTVTGGWNGTYTKQ